MRNSKVSVLVLGSSMCIGPIRTTDFAVVLRCCAMESAICTVGAVSVLPWVPVNVGETKLLAKAWFGDAEYRLLLSDLTIVWEEEMSRDDIQSRAQDLNKRLRAPVQSFFNHLRSVASPCLSGHSDQQSTTAQFSLKQHCDHLIVKLKSELAGVPFYWEFRCSPAPLAVVSRQLVRPLLAISQVLQWQVGELAALLVRKDAEIQDYKENGSMLSRGRLQTEPFDEETYRENFIIQTLPQMGMLLDCLEFNPGLQELYVAVERETMRNKLKSSGDHEPAFADSFNFVPEHIAPDQDQSSVPTGLRSASLEFSRDDVCHSLVGVQEADDEKTVPLKPSAAPDQSSVRPKKRKIVGLFR